MKFILIMTLVTSNGAGITTAEFSSKASCLAAGNTWWDTTVMKLGHYSRTYSTYQCVEK